MTWLTRIIFFHPNELKWFYSRAKRAERLKVHHKNVAKQQLKYFLLFTRHGCAIKSTKPHHANNAKYGLNISKKRVSNVLTFWIHQQTATSIRTRLPANKYPKLYLIRIAARCSPLGLFLARHFILYFQHFTVNFTFRIPNARNMSKGAYSFSMVSIKWNSKCKLLLGDCQKKFALAVSEWTCHQVCIVHKTIAMVDSAKNNHS